MGGSSGNSTDEKFQIKALWGVILSPFSGFGGNYTDKYFHLFRQAAQS
jgi:hypothetical protein